MTSRNNDGPRIAPKTRDERRTRSAVLAALLCFFASATASAYAPPPRRGAVTDAANALAPADAEALTKRLDTYRSLTTNDVAVLVVPALGGEAVEKIASDTFDAWQIGRESAAVLLVLVVAESQTQILPSKNVEARLGEVERARIYHSRMAAALEKRRTSEAIAGGLDGIQAALDGRPLPYAGERKRIPNVDLAIYGGLLLVVLLGLVFKWTKKKPRTPDDGQDAPPEGW